MKPALIAIALSIVPVAGHAQTPEQRAAALGNHREGYERVRFVCLAEGISMPSWDEKNRGDLATEALMARSDEFYRYGAQKGVASANALIAEATAKKMLPKVCDAYKNE